MFSRIFTVNTILIPIRFIDASSTEKITDGYDDVVLEVEVPPPM